MGPLARPMASFFFSPRVGQVVRGGEEKRCRTRSKSIANAETVGKEKKNPERYREEKEERENRLRTMWSGCAALKFRALRRCANDLRTGVEGRFLLMGRLSAVFQRGRLLQGCEVRVSVYPVKDGSLPPGTG